MIAAVRRGNDDQIVPPFYFFLETFDAELFNSVVEEHISFRMIDGLESEETIERMRR